MSGPRFQSALKALLLIGMGLFLYSRIANGTLYFYINQRFALLTLLAVVGLILVGISYRPPPRKDEMAHAHDHSHSLTWSGVALVALPMVLGVLVPPQPLGASALANREVTVGTGGSAMPAAIRAAAEKAATDKNILDWLYDFQAVGVPETFDGQEAHLVGFIYRDERFADDEFSLARFVVSCCVADASFAGLVVRWPTAPEFEDGVWVEVRGRFATGRFDNTTMPILVAESVTPTQMPGQPYLYP